MPKACLIVTLASLSFFVGLLHIGPPLMVLKHLRASGQPFVFGFESHRNDLVYLAWAREIYDGHFPPSDLFSDLPRPTFQHPLPSLLFAGFLAAAGGDAPLAYLAALFVFSQVNFLAFYLLGYRLTRSRVWAACFALVGALSPIAFRILNFDATA